MRDNEIGPARRWWAFWRLPWHDQAPVWCLILVVLGAVIPLANGKSVYHLFREGALMSDISGGLLVLCGIVSLFVFAERRRARPATIGYFIWLIIGVGFVYLAIDEHYELHEKVLEPAILGILGLKESPVTDRLDDLIVGAYGIVGLTSLILCRRELLQFRYAWHMLFWGFVLGAVMVGFDILTNDEALFQGRGMQRRSINHLMRWFGVVEDGSKMIAEGFFIAAFGRAVSLARAMRQAKGISIAKRERQEQVVR